MVGTVALQQDSHALNRLTGDTKLAICCSVLFCLSPMINWQLVQCVPPHPISWYRLQSHCDPDEDKWLQKIDEWIIVPYSVQYNNSLKMEMSKASLQQYCRLDTLQSSDRVQHTHTHTHQTSAIRLHIAPADTETGTERDCQNVEAGHMLRYNTWSDSMM